MLDSISPELNTALAASQLCKECGICCDGTLFSSVVVYHDEPAVLENAGVSVYKKSGGRFKFDQPCPCLSDNQCSIYPTRPKKCRTFSCGLQRKIMNGSMSLLAGLEIVATVKRQSEQLSEQLGPAKPETSKALNLRDHLTSYCKKVAGRGERGKLTLREQTKVSRIFEHLKLIDRFFHETSLLTKYGALIQNIPAPAKSSQGRRYHVSVQPSPE